MPWTYTFHRQAMLNRTTRILKPIAFRTRFHGETIKMLWLKRSCYDLKRSQRFHAKTSPLQWLKTKCYDLTLPLVGQPPTRSRFHHFFITIRDPASPAAGRWLWLRCLFLQPVQKLPAALYDAPGQQEVNMVSFIQWIGLRENLQEKSTD